MLTGPIRFKRASAARWVLVNPVLLSGQPGFETDTGKQKIGNGITAWNDLPYIGAGESVPGPQGPAGPQGETGPQGPQGPQGGITTVVSSNQNAALDTAYENVATATYTDPTPAEGKGFEVYVRNGTATVGGVAYATAGTVIRRIFHSGAWANYVYLSTPLAIANVTNLQTELNNRVNNQRSITNAIIFG